MVTLVCCLANLNFKRFVIIQKLHFLFEIYCSVVVVADWGFDWISSRKKQFLLLMNSIFVNISESGGMQLLVSASAFLLSSLSHCCLLLRSAELMQFFHQRH